MKKLIALALLANACGSSSHSEDQAPIASLAGSTETVTAPIATPSTNPNTNQPGTDAYGHYITTSWYPSDAPALRTDLYSCVSIGNSVGSKFKAYVEVFTDKSRLYHLSISHTDGSLETFTAEESSSKAVAFSPIVMSAGTIQSADVLHGITEQTKEAFGLSDGSNYQINLRSSQSKGNIEMFLKVVSNETDVSISFPYATCYRVGQ